jgi:hypothetical protein
MRTFLLIAFGRPHGLLGRFGGRIMPRTNAEFGIKTMGLLEVEPKDRALAVGFGPGIVLQHLSKLLVEGHAAPTSQKEMVAQVPIRHLILRRTWNRSVSA